MSGRYISSDARAFTQHFYDWEMRLRGYDVWSYPVSPEPPCYSLFDGIEEPALINDDARRETMLSRFAGLFRRFGRESQVRYFDTARTSQDDVFVCPWLPDLSIPEGDYRCYQIVLPRNVEYAVSVCEQFFMALRALRQPLSFELIGQASYIALQCVCRTSDCQFFGGQLAAFFPNAEITEGGDVLARSGLVPDAALSMVDFGLASEVHMPVSSQSEGYDLYVSLVGALGACSEGECALLQILFAPCAQNWPQVLRESVIDDDGSSVFSDGPELVRGVQEKTASPLFGVVIRAVGVASSEDRAHRHVQAIGSALLSSHWGEGNALIPLTNDGYPDDVHLYDITQRMTHRSGMLLSAQELAVLVHLPRKSVVHKKLMVASENTRERPRIVGKETDCSIGINRHHGQAQSVYLDTQQRLRHTYVVGASGTGKSTLLLHMMCADVAAGRGIALLDPHGDLTDDFLARIPMHRRDDVILIDPSDDTYVVGLNILHAHSDAERTLIASDLPRLFERLSSNWGDQMHAVLANGILAMLAHKDGGTLLTLRRFLLEVRFRASFLLGVEDQEVVFYWKNVFPSLSGKPYAPVLTRLDTFLRSEVIRNMVGQPVSTINYDEILERGKILLVKLSHGAIGEENAALLGTLAITAFHQAALRRERLQKEKRDPFFLYVDEFQNFVTPTMEGLLSGARKYGVGLVLAHQELRQLASRDRDVASSVLSNPYTRICFRVGDQDAATLAKGFSSFETQDLQSLGIGRAIVRVEQAQYDFSLETPREAPVVSTDQTEYISERSRELYARPRDAVVTELSVFYSSMQEAESSTVEKHIAKKVHDGSPATTQTQSEQQTGDGEHAPQSHSSKQSEFQEERVPAEKTPGRGGENHKYVQSLIQKLGQERGFRAEIEYKVPGGFVDVALLSEKTKIACEVSVTNVSDYEVGNIQKCLAAGFDHVVLITHDKRKTIRIARALDAIEAIERNKIHILHPKEFLAFMDMRAVESAATEKMVRGYKVRVNYSATDEKQQKVKQDAIAKLMVDSLKRGGRG